LDCRKASGAPFIIFVVVGKDNYIIKSGNLGSTPVTRNYYRWKHSKVFRILRFMGRIPRRLNEFIINKNTF
tara:strand:- start:1094 stop:1306 length:213 start_codon:yes stop_codon:yes gene_type:complete